MPNFYDTSLVQLQTNDYCKTHLLGENHGTFTLTERPSKPLTWSGKVIRWIRGVFRLSRLQYKISQEVKALLQNCNDANRVKLQAWKAILPDFQRSVIEVHNQRLLFKYFQVASLSPTLSLIEQAFPSIPPTPPPPPLPPPPPPSPPIRSFISSIPPSSDSFVPSASGYFPPPGTDMFDKGVMNPFRANIYRDTELAIEKGYVNSSNQLVRLSGYDDCNVTEIFQGLGPLPPSTTHYRTEFSTINGDTFNVMFQLEGEGNRIIGLNMAARDSYGGGVSWGAAAQEETLSRRSTLVSAEKKVAYPLPVVGGAISENVIVFREDASHGYRFMDQPKLANIISVPAINLNSTGRAYYGLPPNPETDVDKEIAVLKANARYMSDTREKLRQTLRQCALKGYNTLVLGAFGCGAFHNPPRLIAELYEELFNDPEFKGLFKKVVFAVLEAVPSDKANGEQFTALCNRLMTTLPTSVVSNAIPSGIDCFVPVSGGYYPPTGPNTDWNRFREGIYKDTKMAIEKGYVNSANQYISLNGTDCNITETFQNLGPLPDIDVRHNTEFSTINDDTFNVMFRFQGQGNMIGLNMANLHTPGGGVEWGASAQEECLARRSTLVDALKKVPYPLPVLGGSTSKNVIVFRGDPSTGYRFMDQPKLMDIISVAVVDLHDTASRAHYGLPPTINADANVEMALLKANTRFMNDTREKLRQMLRQCSLKGYDLLVLGAIGCGAFANPPRLIAELFEELFKDREFKGRFKKVVFAVLEVVDRDKLNGQEFRSLCSRLMSTP